MNPTATRKILITLSLSLLFIALTVFLVPRSTLQALDNVSVYYVAPSCAGVPAPCFTSLQAAVDAVDEPTDIIKVAAGTYTDVHARLRRDISTTGVVTQVVYISKTLMIRGGYTPTNWTTPDPDANLTTLDAQGQGRIVYVTGNISPALEGLHMTGGNAAKLGGTNRWHDYGGGMYVITASVTLKKNWIFNNTAFAGGGGVYIWYGNGTALNGNIIYSNTTAAGCAGVEMSAWGLDVNNFIIANTFTSNTVLTSNEPGGGTGFCLGGSSAFIAHNLISSNQGKGGGGGMWLGGVSAVLQHNNILANQTSGTGGGLEADQSSLLLVANILANNSAQSGGGLWFYNCDVIGYNNLLYNNVGAASGGGIYANFVRLNLYHSTIAHNSPSGIYDIGNASDINSLNIFNTIIASQDVGIDAPAARLTATLWHSNTTNWISISETIDNYAGDPAFINPNAGDYHIGASSVAIDRGVPTSVVIDIDNQPRFGIPDLGADEYWAPGTLKQMQLPVLLKN
jgi:hypothetical protein